MFTVFTRRCPRCWVTEFVTSHMYLPCEPKSWTNERYVPEHPPRSKEQVSSLLKFMHKLLAKDVPKVVIVLPNL